MKSIKYIIKTGAFVLFFVIMSIDLHAQEDPNRPLPQFLFPGFTRGVIILKDGTRFSSLLNYNMVDEIMVSELNGVYRSASNPQDIDTIYLQNRKFVPVKNVFYEVLAVGPATFFLQNKSNYTPKGSSIGYGMKSQSVSSTSFKRFEFGQDYVVTVDLPPNVTVTPASVNWVSKNDKMEKFISERQFLKIFPEKEAQLKEYIKKEKIDLKDREDLIKLGTYCNELLK
jgi:hypothetical protein